MSSQREEEESWGGAVVLLCFVSGRPEGSGIHQLWTLVLQTLHQLILGPVWFFRRLLSPVWSKLQNRCWSLESDESHQKILRFSVSDIVSCLSADPGLQEVLDEHKLSLRRRCEHVTEGADETGSRILLNRIYTELYITEGQSEEVNTQHEVWQLETASKRKILHDTPIKCHDIFKASKTDQQSSIRVVLTNGRRWHWKNLLGAEVHSGTGAEGLENQDVGSADCAFVQGAEPGERPAAQSSHAAPCFPSSVTEAHCRDARCL